jgi:phosphoethanolamine N-methyltransferase
MSYTQQFTDALQFVWGDGFLSPGGPEEIRQILNGHDLSGRNVLDIGSGLGGIDLLLVGEHQAGHVTGIDIDEYLVARANERVRDKGLTDRIAFRIVVPGPLPFPDASFDVVFTKDAMIHIPDKQAIYAETMRVLKPGGRFIGSDWLFGEGAAEASSIKEWLGDNSMGFIFTTPNECATALSCAGFEDIRVTGNSDFVAGTCEEEVAKLEGPAIEELARLIGKERAGDRLTGARLRLQAIRTGGLRPSHLYARKPG